MEMLKQTFEAVQAQAMYKLKHIFDKRNTETQEETAKQAFVVSRQQILKIRDAIQPLIFGYASHRQQCFTQITNQCFILHACHAHCNYTSVSGIGKGGR